MKASRAAQGLGKHSRPRVLKRWSSSAFSESSALRSGARHFWCQSERDLAAAIRSPSVDAVHAAPGAVLVDFHFPLGRMKLEKLAVVGQSDVRVLGQPIEHVGQRHVAVRHGDGRRIRRRWRYA